MKPVPPGPGWGPQLKRLTSLGSASCLSSGSHPTGFSEKGNTAVIHERRLAWRRARESGSRSFHFCSPSRAAELEFPPVSVRGPARLGTCRFLPCPRLLGPQALVRSLEHPPARLTSRRACELLAKPHTLGPDTTHRLSLAMYLMADALCSRAGGPAKCTQVPRPGKRGPKAQPRLGGPTCAHLLHPGGTASPTDDLCPTHTGRQDDGEEGAAQATWVRICPSRPPLCSLNLGPARSPLTLSFSFYKTGGSVPTSQTVLGLNQSVSISVFTS